MRIFEFVRRVKTLVWENEEQTGKLEIIYTQMDAGMCLRIEHA